MLDEVLLDRIEDIEHSLVGYCRNRSSSHQPSNPLEATMKLGLLKGEVASRIDAKKTETMSDEEVLDILGNYFRNCPPGKQRIEQLRKMIIASPGEPLATTPEVSP